MKIGEVVKITGLSKDTIRYYINEGLILPSTNNSYFSFNQKDIKDIKYIQFLKSIGCSLKEVKEILFMQRLSNDKDDQFLNEYKKHLYLKKDELHQKIDSCYNKLKSIDDEIDRILELKKKQKNDVSGVPLIALEYLACPHCQNSLTVEGAELSAKGITNGLLTCHCGYKAAIEDGIIITENVPVTPYDQPDLSRQLHMVAKDEVAFLMKKTYDAIADNLNTVDSHDKIVLETNINNTFFTYIYFQDIRAKLYIVTDKYKEMLYKYKTALDSIDANINILYIADNSTNYPIRKQSVDIFIDCFACTSHNLYFSSFLPQEVYPFLKYGGHVCGAFIYFDIDSKTIGNIPKQYPECCTKYMCFSSFSQKLKQIYPSALINKMGTVTKTPKGKYLYNCHVDGEHWNMVEYSAKKE